jgi:hypothetical protein
MKNYIVRVYRAHPSCLDSISGVVEDIEFGQIGSFHNFDELQALLNDSIRTGQYELSCNPLPEEKPGIPVVVNA